MIFVSWEAWGMWDYPWVFRLHNQASGLFFMILSGKLLGINEAGEYDKKAFDSNSSYYRANPGVYLCYARRC
jgi:hypothetical protein